MISFTLTVTAFPFLLPELDIIEDYPIEMDEAECYLFDTFTSFSSLLMSMAISSPNLFIYSYKSQTLTENTDNDSSSLKSNLLSRSSSLCIRD
jgi:hypothetical protein